VTSADGAGCGDAGPASSARLPGGAGSPSVLTTEDCPSVGWTWAGRTEAKASGIRRGVAPPSGPGSYGPGAQNPAVTQVTWAGGPARDRPVRKAGHGVRRSAPAPLGASPPRLSSSGISAAPGRLKKSPARSRMSGGKTEPMMSRSGAANSLHPPLEGEGRCERQRAAGWGERLAVGVTPPRRSSRFARCAPTLPLQGRVKACPQHSQN